MTVRGLPVGLLVESFLALLVGRFLAGLPFSIALRVLQLEYAEARDVTCESGNEGKLENFTRAVEAWARRVPWRSDCLPCAYAALMVLHRRGFRPSLHLGAANAWSKEKAPSMHAHAWVVCDGTVITGASTRSQYVVVGSWERPPNAAK